MAVKRLKMMNVVCKNENLDEILKDLILHEKCQFADVKKEIDESDFYIAMTEENADEILDMEDVSPIKTNFQIREYSEKIRTVAKGLGYEPALKKELMKGKHDFFEIVKNTEDIYKKFENLTKETDETKKRIAKLDEMEYLEEIKEINIDLHKLMNMEHFTAKFGFLSKQKRKKIAANYENIFAVVLHIGTFRNNELYIIVSPKKLDQELERILKSTEFKEIILEEKYLSYPEKSIQMIKNDKKLYAQKLTELIRETEEFLESHKKEIDMLFSKLVMEEKINDIKKKIVSTQKYSYFSCWFPDGKEEEYNNIFRNYENVLSTYKEDKDVTADIPVPTLLHNSSFFSPFENLVNMYGVPNYNETDATIFFGIAYIIIFGAMFGDLGQGLVFLLAGMFLSRKRNKNFGELLMRIGTGSMFFGIIYDSFFGYEHIISKFIPLPIYLRPMENINTLLITAILAGIILLTISYFFSIYNKLKLKEFGKGIFGKNGINGMILFFLILIMVYRAATGISVIPGILLNTLIWISVGLLVFEEPLGNLIKGNDELFEESKAEYFTESGFNILETFLAIVSNSVSFIRVGAFALNHVGLFVAFHIMSDIIGTLPGNIIMFLLGNIIIIGLEGLIVFIQGLRLFYYEMFSKFYKGEGILFVPDKI